MSDLVKINGDFFISTEIELMDVDVITEFLKNAYWSKGITKEIVRKSIQNSLCFGLFKKEDQIGFARIISDYSTFAYLCDFFVLEPYQKKGLGTWVLETIMNHPELRSLRKFCLSTKDRQELYKKFGFETPKDTSNYMEIKRPNIYLEQNKRNSELYS